MVITNVEGKVPPEQWAVLEQAYQKAAEGLPPQMSQTFLIHSTAEPTLWRILSVWHSREALEEMRRTVETPGALLVFRAAGVEPTLTIFDVAVHRTA